MTNKPKKEPIAIINGGIDMWQKKGGGHITRKTKGRVVYGKPKTNKWEKFLDKKVMSFGGIGFNFWVKVKEKDVLELITQTQQETLEMSRKIVTKRLEIWKENHIAEMADSDSVEWAIYNLVSDIDFDLMQQCQTIKQRKEGLK